MSEPLPQPAANSVFIVDDEPLVLSELHHVLSASGFQAVKFLSAERFLDFVTPELSGCLLVDVRLAGMSGLELQEQLVHRNPLLSVIVMTGHADVPLAIRAMKAGALEMLQKPFNHQQLIAQVRVALTLSQEKALRSTRMAEALAKPERLTDREREVLAGVARGLQSKAIARELEISWRTVEVHRARILEKLDVKNSVELVNLINAASGIAL